MKGTLKRLSTPHKIQEYVDNLSYNVENITRSARGVIQSKKAQCLDGALLASAALEYHGHVPRLMDLRANERDADHVLAIYQYKGHYGAIAKSNYVGIRFREPVYRTPRELAVSYFNNYVSPERERTLREYSRIIHLKNFNAVDWRNAPVDEDIYDPLADKLENAQHYRLFPKAIERALRPSDERLVKAEMLGINLKGLYKA